MSVPGLSESHFQDQVIQLARIHGWRVAHFRPARTESGWRTAVSADGAGFLDLTLVRATELIFAELKGENGRVRPEQQEWIAALEVVAGAVTAAAGVLDQCRGERRGRGTSPSPAVEVYLWRPAQFDEIHARLSRRVPTTHPHARRQTA